VLAAARVKRTHTCFWVWRMYALGSTDRIAEHDAKAECSRRSTRSGTSWARFLPARLLFRTGLERKGPGPTGRGLKQSPGSTAFSSLLGSPARYSETGALMELNRKAIEAGVTIPGNYSGAGLS